MHRLLVHFARYGPYHYARLREAMAALIPSGWEVSGLEIAGTDATYAWDAFSPETGEAKVITAFPGRVYEEIRGPEARRVLFPLLDEIKPDVVAIAGWSGPDALACLTWCRRNGARALVMSETREADGQRVWWKEWLKRRIISRFDGALVGGRSHRGYLVRLGMPAEKIGFGYNVVDNRYFAEASRRSRQKRLKAERHETEEQWKGVAQRGLTESHILPQNKATSSLPSAISLWFLASNRFVGRKNLERLIEAYASYAQRSQGEVDLDHPASLGPITTQRPSAIWNLCLLGDGELKSALIAQCHTYGLDVIESAPWEVEEKAVIPRPTPHNGNSAQLAAASSPTVFFPGFRQIEELPRFYAHAACFIHPALEEPWGLVINEAMACGLPILSGSNVGAAEELVDEGVNGWKFEATEVEEISKVLSRMAALDEDARHQLGRASERILAERCPTTAFGRGMDRLLAEDLVHQRRQGTRGTSRWPLSLY